jgi:S-phase kinase-associated protein 1
MVKSTVINMMVEDIVNSDDVVPLADKACTQEIMLLVVKYLQKHTMFEKEKTDDMTVIAFDNEFQDQPDKTVFHIILAANFLDIKNLLELMCKKIADDLKKCKTPEDVRNRFNIRVDYTPDEVDAVRNAHDWFFKKKDNI